jgi:fructose-1,6-bisphosphatase I/sedoheptulose-1,7-bisphosphatase
VTSSAAPFQTKTITRFLIEEQRHVAARMGGPPSGSLTALINDVRLAVKRIAALTGKGALAGVAGEAGQEPAGDGASARLDALADELFVRTSEWGGQLAGMLSRGCEKPQPIPAEYPAGRYLLLFNALEGSSNLDVDVSVGSIFSVLRCPEGVSTPGPQDFLQPGAAQVCAGYAIYGPSTMLVLTTGNGVNGFTLDREIGEFMLTHPDLRMPRDTCELAVNASGSRHWEPAIKRYVNECMAGKSGPRGRDFDMRWIASLVADTHRILLRGGVFLCPWDRRNTGRPGRPRLLHEANPIGFIIEQAGGRGSTGLVPILDVTPDSVQQRTSFVFGSCAEVERIERYHRDHNEFELDSPLFGRCGLFTS